MKQTQLDWIVEQLEEYGEISRNQCLSRFISRLGARINDLKAQGWEFRTEWRSNDYFYVVVAAPKPRQLAMSV